MGYSSAQNDAAEWICEHQLPGVFNQAFSRQRVKLACGGSHSFAAVSSDLMIVGAICTGAAATSAGRLAVAKLNKVRADLYFLMLADCKRRFIVVTQPIMYELLRIEQAEYRRIPPDVELIHIRLPRELQERLERAHQMATHSATLA